VLVIVLVEMPITLSLEMEGVLVKVLVLMLITLPLEMEGVLVSVLVLMLITLSLEIKAAMAIVLVRELWTVTLARIAATVFNVATIVLVMCLTIHVTPAAMRMTLMLRESVNIARFLLFRHDNVKSGQRMNRSYTCSTVIE
jgi:hypothetical protein